MNKLPRSITKWTKACDKRLNRLISYIHHTCEYKQYGYVGNTAKQCRLGLCQDSDFAGDLEDSYVDEIKKVGKKENMAPMWKRGMKNVDLDEPVSFLDHDNLGCTQCECKPNEIFFEEFRKCSNHEFLLEQQKKLPWCAKLHAKTVAWSYDMEGHAKKCVGRCCELANNKTEQLYKVSSPCLDDHHFKKEEPESVGELSKVCSQMLVFVTNW